MKYILSEMREKHYKPLKLFRSTLITDYYPNTNTKRTRNEKKININEKRPMSSIQNKLDSNFNKYTISSEIEVRKKILFTDSEYPLSINNTEENFGLNTTKSFFSPLTQINKNIIEYINNSEAMVNLLPNYYYRIIEDKFEYKNYNNYVKIMGILNEKIHNYEDSNISSLTKGFKLKKFERENIFLTLKSIKLKIINQKKNDKMEFFLPFNLLPFYYAFSIDKFINFLLMIIEITKDNKIEVKKEEIKKLEMQIGKSLDLFKENSLLFNNRSQDIKKFYFLFNNEIYLFEIIPPKIELRKNKGAKIIKNAGKGLLIYLIENDFFNWYNCTLCYLSSIKSFREQVHSIFQIKKNINIINIDKFKINFCFCYENNYNDYINNKKEFSFLAQLKHNNQDKIYLLNFKCYMIEISFEQIVRKFHLTFYEMKLLYNLIQKGYNSKEIIYKCLIINEKENDFTFSIKLLKDLDVQKFDNFFYKSKNNNILNKLKIILHYPIIEYFQLEDRSKLELFEEIKYIFKVPYSLIGTLINTNFEKWGKVLYNISHIILNPKNEFNANKIVEQDNNRKSKTKKSLTKRKTKLFKFSKTNVFS
jgi:hypothetical protein